MDLDILFCLLILRILDPDFWLRHISAGGSSLRETAGYRQMAVVSSLQPPGSELVGDLRPGYTGDF